MATMCLYTCLDRYSVFVFEVYDVTVEASLCRCSKLAEGGSFITRERLRAM